MVSTVRVCHNRFNVVVRDMLRYGGDEVAGGEDLEVALNLQVEAGAGWRRVKLLFLER